ncbi:amino acid ABC transporter amino acid-binding protein/permease [Streptococcus agalactiae]|nr:amino acid ABC transporter amino acid-binding protein/permease [Streptococcus agalactiae]
MTTLITTFQERFGDWTQSLIEHLQLSLLTLILATLIAIPLGIIISHYKKISHVVLQITGIFQTIPSLALLGLFIPFMGIWNCTSCRCTNYLRSISNFTKYCNSTDAN